MQIVVRSIDDGDGLGGRTAWGAAALFCMGSELREAHGRFFGEKGVGLGNEGV